MIVTLNLFQGLCRKIDAETSSAGRISGEVAALCRFYKESGLNNKSLAPAFNPTSPPTAHTQPLPSHHVPLKYQHLFVMQWC